MPSDQLTLIVGDNGDEHYVRGIPSGFWEAFKCRAAEIMPERDPKTAWGDVLAEVMAAVVDEGNLFTLLMYDIPSEAGEALHNVTQAAGITREYLIAALFDLANKNELSVVRFDNGNAGHMLVVADISAEAWEFWRTTANENGMSPEVLVAALFGAAHEGTLRIGPNAGGTSGETGQSIQRQGVGNIRRFTDAVEASQRRRVEQALDGGSGATGARRPDSKQS